MLLPSNKLIDWSTNHLQMVGELIKNISEEEGEYKPVDGPEIGSLIFIDRGQFCMICTTIPLTTRQFTLMKYSLLGHCLSLGSVTTLPNEGDIFFFLF